MYYACILDKWSGELVCADPFDTYEEAQAFCTEELKPWPSEKTAVLTEREYRKIKEAL